MENKTFKDVIKNHLDGRARTDELFAKSYAKKKTRIWMSAVPTSWERHGNGALPWP